jgi:ABC-type amino acid transport system permease subunit
MIIKQWTKLLVCILVIMATTLLMMFDKIEAAAGVALISGTMGYVFGNGHAMAENRRGTITKINPGG